jgi:glycosyltransferase 2 family protein
MIAKILIRIDELWRFVGQQKFLEGKQSFRFTIIAILLTTTILGYLLFSQWEILVSQEWNIRPEYALFAFVVYSIILFLNVMTWTNIMRNLGSRVDLSTHFRSTAISALGKRLPGTFWYVLWRTHIYKGDTSPKIIVFASGLEMAVTVIAAILVCALFSVQMIFGSNFNWIGFIIVLIFCLFFLHPRFLNWLMQKINLDRKRIGLKNLALWTGIYVIIWLLVGMLLFLIGRIFTQIPLSQLGYFIGSTALTGVLSRLLLFSPSILGFGEISLSLLLTGIMPSSFAVIIAISNRMIIITFELIWAVLTLVSNRLKIDVPRSK